MADIKQFNELTVNVWVYFNELDNYNIVEQMDSFVIGYTDGEGFFCKIKDTNDAVFEIQSAEIANIEEWHMITMTYGTDQLKLFIDGTEIDSVSVDGNAVNEGRTGIVFGKFEGRGQELRIYDYPIDAEDILDLYNVVDRIGIFRSSEKHLE